MLGRHGVIGSIPIRPTLRETRICEGLQVLFFKAGIQKSIHFHTRKSIGEPLYEGFKILSNYPIFRNF